jgi:hypothetical protein
MTTPRSTLATMPPSKRRKERGQAGNVSLLRARLLRGQQRDFDGNHLGIVRKSFNPKLLNGSALSAAALGRSF